MKQRRFLLLAFAFALSLIFLIPRSAFSIISLYHEEDPKYFTAIEIDGEPGLLIDMKQYFQPGEIDKDCFQVESAGKTLAISSCRLADRNGAAVAGKGNYLLLSLAGTESRSTADYSVTQIKDIPDLPLSAYFPRQDFLYIEPEAKPEPTEGVIFHLYKNDSKQISRLIVQLEAPVDASAVDASCFSVHAVANYDEDLNITRELYSDPYNGLQERLSELYSWGDQVNIASLMPELVAAKMEDEPFVLQYNVFDGDRTVTKAYVADENGLPLSAGKGDCIIIELDMESGAATQAASGNWTQNPLQLEYTISQLKDIDGLPVDTVYAQSSRIISSLDVFSYETSAANISYRLYTPADDGDSDALIVYFHGMTAEGHNNETQMGANVALLAKDKYQQLFRGAYVVLPQCPTYWPGKLEPGYDADDHSPWVDEILDLIAEVCAAHPDIDKSRIYVGGFSMGGYMCWQMAINEPELFAAAFPSAAPYAPSAADIERLGDLPIWVTMSWDDNVVDPQLYQSVSIERLEAGKANYEASVYSDVGHSDTPAMTNVNVNQDGIHMMQWLAAKTNVRESKPPVVDEGNNEMTPPTPAISTRSYTVKKGDCLWRIAKKQLKSGPRYTEIMELNGLTSTIIHAGQVLQLPEK